MKKYHDISGLKFEDSFLVITIDGEPKKYPLKYLELFMHHSGRK